MNFKDLVIKNKKATNSKLGFLKTEWGFAYNLEDFSYSLALYNKHNEFLNIIIKYDFEEEVLKIFDNEKIVTEIGVIFPNAFNEDEKYKNKVLVRYFSKDKIYENPKIMFVEDFKVNLADIINDYIVDDVVLA